MKRITKNIPNTLTICNLLAGCVGMITAVNGDFITPFYCLIASLIFDFADGFAARLLKAYSPMGKELDSLADMVSFGVVPSVIMFNMGAEWFAFTITAFSALRLAKFNIDTRQNDSFIGLPTPANAIFFVSLGYIVFVDRFSFTADLIRLQWVQYILITGFSLLLTSELPMFSLKFKSYAWKNNKLVYSFLIATVIALILWQITALPYIIIGYLLVSFIVFLADKKIK